MQAERKTMRFAEFKQHKKYITWNQLHCNKSKEKNSPDGHDVRLIKRLLNLILTGSWMLRMDIKTALSM